MNKKISVIIPVYNADEYVEKCIRSIMNQTYTNLEIIIINDGSIDNSLSICRNLANIDSRIRIIEQSNCGVSIARNTGLDNATGDYISFVDSDDTIDLKCFERLLDESIKNDLDVVGCNICVITENGKFYPYEKNGNIDIFDNNKIINQYLNFHISLAVWGKIYKKSLIEKIRFFETNINEDFIFSWEVMKKTKRFKQVNDVHYSYYTSIKKSLTKQRFSKNNMLIINHAKKVVSDVNRYYPWLEAESKNYFNACVLHNYINYYQYITNNFTQDLFFDEKIYMESLLTDIKKIDNCILEQEKYVDIEELIVKVNKYIDLKSGDKKCL